MTWNFGRRLPFCFAFAYFVLYLFPFPLDAVAPALSQQFWDPIVTAAGSLLGVEITARPQGSGDTTWNYVQVIVLAVLSAAIAIVWSALHRNPEHYERLHRWLRVYIRFALAAAMIGYGAFKVVPSQFLPPSPGRLMQPFGQASPMGLLWTFMGASIPYTIFTGIGELAGGFFLLFRRTVTLGALITAAVMTHVVVLNFSYDVPVKLYSAHLLAMAIFLLIPVIPELTRYFTQSGEPPLFASRRVQWIATAIVALGVVAFSVMQCKTAIEVRGMYADRVKDFPLAGVWYAERVVVDGVEQPPLLTNAARWQHVVLDKMEMSVQLVSQERQRFRLTHEESSKRLLLARRENPEQKYPLSYAIAAPDTLELRGLLEGRQVEAHLRRTGASDFPLTTRGFHWVNEYPYNR
jgi:hypothetical protein